MSHELTAYFSIFNLFKLDELCPYQQHVNQIVLNCITLKLDFTNITDLHSNFVDCESSHESNSPNILALCETNLDDSIDSGNFSVRGYLPLIRKDSSTHMHGLTVYVKEGLPFTWNLSLEDSEDSYFFDHLLLLCAWFLILFCLT